MITDTSGGLKYVLPRPCIEAPLRADLEFSQCLCPSGYNPNPFRTLHIVADNLRTLPTTGDPEPFFRGISVQQAFHLFIQLF